MFDKGVQYILPDQRKEEEGYANRDEWLNAYEATKQSGDSEAYKSKVSLLNFLMVGIETLF